MIVLDLTQNIALLVALTALHQFVLRRWRPGSPVYTVSSGLLFGVVGIIGMMTPITLAPGLIYDSRSIMLSTAGMFGGPLVGLISAVMCTVYRIALGGMGMWVGIGTIVESTLLGIAMYQLRRRDARVMGMLPLWIFGMLVHVIMILIQLLLPARETVLVIHQIAPPVLVLFPLGTVLVARLFLDQEERLATQQRLQESEERHRSMFENNHAVMLLVDPDTAKIVDANPAAATYYGHAREAMRGMPVGEINLLSPEQLQREMDSARHAGRHYFHFRHRLAGGEVRDVEVFSGPVVADGRTLLLSIVHDITARRKMESELISALDRAERADRLKDQFIANMSHEIRTPLNIILGYTGLLDDVIDASKREVSSWMTESIEQAGSRLMRTVDLVLSFSSLSAGAYQPTLRSTDLRTLVAEAGRQFTPLAARKNLRLTVHAPAGMPQLVCDRYTIEQALANLLDNAIKFTDHGSITVELRVDGTHAVIAVSDTGIGISDAYLPQLFVAFTQEHAGYTRPYEGLGLGLSLVKLYAEMNGGKVQVRSRPGEGSTFEMWLPMAGAQAPAGGN